VGDVWLLYKPEKPEHSQNCGQEMCGQCGNCGQVIHGQLVCG